MIKKVYIAKNQDDAKEEILADFPNTHIINCECFDFEDFCRSQQKSLFDSNNKKLIAFTSVDEYALGDLLEVCDKVSREVIWCFGSLAKNTKLFKKLKATTSLEEVSGLEKQSDKTRYIKSLLNKYNIPITLEDHLSVVLPDNKAVIKQEVNKITLLIAEGFSIPEIKNAVCVYNNDLDSILFVQALLNKQTKKTYTLASKISDKISPLQLNALLTKKIKSLIFLCRGESEEANKYWYTGNYYLSQEIKLAKSIGLTKLFSLYEEVEKVLGNKFDDQPLFPKLMYLFNFHTKDVVLFNTM